MRLLTTSALLALFAIACTTAVDGDGANKDKLAASIANGADLPADGAGDPCYDEGWYGDGFCDAFCPRLDEDCEANSFCAAALCGPGTICSDEERRCIPECDCPDGYRCDDLAKACVEDNGSFCTRALCGPGYVCDEDLDACVAADLFCPAALCAPGTVCDEELDACVADEPSNSFCTRALCAEGFECDEELDACVPSQDFCPRATCGPGYVCNEATDSCDPEGDFCTRALCGPGTVCNEATDACEAVACEDTCAFANDGECDDGGPGSDYSACSLGTDCGDCGAR